MSTPDPYHSKYEPRPDRSPGFEKSDVNVSGVAVFLASLLAFVAVFFVFCFGLGKAINMAIIRHDGPPNRWSKWNTTSSPSELKGQNMESSAALEQEELKAMTQRFPTPRVQTDDGDQDVADLHAREDLLLDFYTWSNRQQHRVRIPIGRAMELLAQRGLPVAPAAQAAPLMTGDHPHVVPAPLTDGFARTGYEQQFQTEIEQQRERGEKPADQAMLQSAH